MANLPKEYHALMRFVVGRKPKDVQADLKTASVDVKRDAIARCQQAFMARVFEATPDVSTLIQAHAHYLRHNAEKENNAA